MIVVVAIVCVEEEEKVVVFSAKMRKNLNCKIKGRHDNQTFALIVFLSFSLFEINEVFANFTVCTHRLFGDRDAIAKVECANSIQIGKIVRITK
jgi:hypothetical protein